MHHAIVFNYSTLNLTQSIWYLSVFHKLLSQNAVGENPQKNCPATQVQMDQLRHIATQNMPN